MALKFNLTNSSVGVPFETAYAKITGFQGSAAGVDYNVGVFATQGARNTDAQQVAAFAYRYQGELNGSIMDLLYADLKTRPGFENAEDC